MLKASSFYETKLRRKISHKNQFQNNTVKKTERLVVLCNKTVPENITNRNFKIIQIKMPKGSSFYATKLRRKISQKPQFQNNTDRKAEMLGLQPNCTGKYHKQKFKVI